MSQPKNILLVEDDEDDQILFRDALAEINNTVDCQVANNGREALVSIGIPPPPELIFVDLNMPIMNGFEFLSALKNEDRYKNIPVIIFSTTSDPDTIKKTHQLGASAYLRKPADFKLMRTKLNRLLNTKFTTHESAHPFSFQIL